MIAVLAYDEFCLKPRSNAKNYFVCVIYHDGDGGVVRICSLNPLDNIMLVMDDQTQKVRLY